jgi:hypothetical protein
MHKLYKLQISKFVTYKNMLEKEVINFEKTAIVIVTQNQSEEKLNEYLDELEF